MEYGTKKFQTVREAVERQLHIANLLRVARLLIEESRCLVPIARADAPEAACKADEMCLKLAEIADYLEEYQSWCLNFVSRNAGK